MAQSLGTIGGALLRDIAYRLTGNVALGYMVVFALEIIGLIIALLLFRTISVEVFRRDAELDVADVLTTLAGD